MELNIHAGMRVLYKNGGSGWLVGELQEGKAEINYNGLYFPIIPKEYIGQENPEEIHWCEINNIFWDSFKIDDWIKDYHEYFMTKEDYINFIESEDFNKQMENACVSDGEYGYYPVTRFTKNWIEKQPFEYIIRGD